MSVTRKVLGFVCALLATPLYAQTIPQIPVDTTVRIDPSTLSDTELLDLLQQLEDQRANAPSRVALFGIPSGFGAQRGIWFVSVAATNRRDRNRLGDWDASIALGFGMGDPVNGVGITPVLDITSVSPHHFGESGKLGVKISRELRLAPRWRGAVGLDLDNLLTWGDSRVLDRTWTVSGTAIRSGRYPVMLSAGYGTGVAVRGTDPGGFAGIGVGLNESLGLSLGWYGDEAIAGANIWAGRNKNLQISLGFGDITNEVSGRRFLVAISLARPFRANR